MRQYLLDTNICIYYILGKFSLNAKFQNINKEQLFISEISLAELKFGVKNSQSKKRNQNTLDDFLTGVQILPILNSLDVYAEEKSRLKKQGNIIDEFDLLIGASAVANNMILITNNVKHFKRLNNIEIEDWTHE